MRLWPDSIVKEIFDLGFNCRMEETAGAHKGPCQRTQDYASGVPGPGESGVTEKALPGARDAQPGPTLESPGWSHKGHPSPEGALTL